MKKLLLAAVIALWCAIPAYPQVPVQLSPVAHQQFLSNSGAPLAGGFVFLYQNGTTTPAPSYVDSSGTVLATNPIQLDSGGFASIWLAQTTYTVCVADSNLTQQWCENGVTSGANLLNLANVWQSPQTWNALGTFLSGVSITGGLQVDTINTSGGIGVGGAPVSLTNGINGNPGWVLAVSNSSLVTFTAGNVGISGALSITGQIDSSVATGSAPFQVASSTVVANLNAAQLNGQTFASPGSIGFTIPSSGFFTDLNDTALTPGACVQVSGGGFLITPTTVQCLNPAVSSVTLKNLASGTTLVASTTKTVDSQVLTMPASGCPCRVLVNYTYFNHAPGGGSTPATIAFWATDSMSSFAMSEVAVSSVSDGQANSGTGTSASFVNGASVTISIMARSDAAQDIDQHDLVGAGLNSNLQLSVVTSQ